MANLNSGLTDQELIDSVNKAHDISSTAGEVDGSVAHAAASHAPTDADNTAANETSHANVVVDGDIGTTVQGYNADTVVDANYVQTEESFTTTEQTKLGTIEDSATADQTGAEIKTAYEAEADTNAYDNAAVTKLGLAPVSDPTGVTGADAISNMMSLTQAEYDAIGTPDANTFYLIVE